MLTEITLKFIEKYIESQEALKFAMSDTNYHSLVCKTLSKGLMLINTMGAIYEKTVIDVLIQNDILYKNIIKSICLLKIILVFTNCSDLILVQSFIKSIIEFFHSIKKEDKSFIYFRFLFMLIFSMVIKDEKLIGEYKNDFFNMILTLLGLVISNIC